MEIKRLNNGTLNAGRPVREAGTEASRHVENQTLTSARTSSTERPEKQDRAEFSPQAREAATDARLREMAFARKALLNIPPLTEEKLQEIRERIKESYYTGPEVVKELANKLVDVFKGED